MYRRWPLSFPLTSHPSPSILLRLNSRQYVLGLVDNVEAPAILITPTNVGRRGSTSRMLESPARHYEARIDMNRFVTSTVRTVCSHAAAVELVDLRDAGLPRQNSEVNASATKFERCAARPWLCRRINLLNTAFPFSV